MISTPDRRKTVELIETAMAQGARQDKACEVLGLSERTYQRWTQQGGVEADQRPLVERQAPSNKLSEAERQQVLDTCNSPAYRSLPPSQIVPILADRANTSPRNRASTVCCTKKIRWRTVARPRHRAR